MTAYKEETFNISSSISINRGEVKSIRVLYSNHNDYEVNINGEGFTPLKKGLEVNRPENINTIGIKNNKGSSTPLEITISFTDGKTNDNTISLDGAIKVKSGDVITGFSANVSALTVEICASGQDETFRLLQNHDADNDVWIGGSDIDPTEENGICLSPKQIANFQVSAALFAKRTSGNGKVGGIKG